MLLVTGVVFGLLCAALALDRGRSVLLWFLAGLVIGPFGLVVLALPRKAKAGRYDNCPACHEVIRHEAMVCRHCGAELEDASQSAQSVAG